MAIERIQLRRGTTVEWNDANPILAFGEPGVEIKTDTTISVKIGDGSTTWSALPYFGELEGDFITSSELTTELSSYSTTSQMNAAINTSVSAGLASLVDSAPTTLDTLNEIAAALGDDPDFATTITTSLGNVENTANSAQTTANNALSLATSNQTDIANNTTDISTKSEIGHTHDASEITNTINEVTGSTYSIQASDNGKFLSLNPSGGTITVTIDDVLSVGQRIDVYLRGTSATFAAGTGTIESAGLSMVNQYTVASIACVASGVYAIAGSVE